MSDDLKNIYEAAGKSDRFFDSTTPIDLFRGQKTGDPFDLLQPTLIGWVVQSSGRPRDPDVLLTDASGRSPQYKDGHPESELVTEPRSKPTTAQLVSDASAYVVKGCRTLNGNFRGVSVFDKANNRLGGFDWFRIPSNTQIPPGLAVTRDGDRARPGESLHYTIAPKDDMPLSLFLQHLKGFSAVAKKA